MKKGFKLFVKFFAIIMAVVCSLSMVGCREKIQNVSLEISVYDYENSKFYNIADTTMSIQLYSHLAPETCEAMKKYIQEGYYNNALIYQNKSYNQIMLGDLVVDGDAIEILDGGKTTNIKLNDIKPEIKGEFEKGGVVGSNLTNQKGSIGLWRSWYKNGLSYTTSGAYNSGRATWFMPTIDNNGFDDYFCVFALFDLEDESTSNAFSVLENLYKDADNYTDFTIFYTGEYDASKKDENYGLTFHCVTSDYYDTLTEDDFVELFGAKLFEAEGKQLVCFNKYEIKVANNGDGKCGAIVNKASLVK